MTDGLVTCDLLGTADLGTSEERAARRVRGAQGVVRRGPGRRSRTPTCGPRWPSCTTSSTASRSSTSTSAISAYEPVVKIAVAGGGPGGPVLLDPDAEGRAGLLGHGVRAQPGDGRVRLRGRVLRRDADRVRARRSARATAAITERFARWTDIDIHHRGSVTRSGGHGFSALGRRELLGDPAGARAGARRRVRFRTEAPPVCRLGLGGPGRRRRRRRRARCARRLPRVRALARAAPLSLHVAWDRPRVRRIQVLHRRDPARRLPGARISVRRRR